MHKKCIDNYPIWPPGQLTKVFYGFKVAKVPLTKLLNFIWKVKNHWQISGVDNCPVTQCCWAPLGTAGCRWAPLEVRVLEHWWEFNVMLFDQHDDFSEVSQFLLWGVSWRLSSPLKHRLWDGNGVKWRKIWWQFSLGICQGLYKVIFVYLL